MSPRSAFGTPWEVTGERKTWAEVGGTAYNRLGLVVRPPFRIRGVLGVQPRFRIDHFQNVGDPLLRFTNCHRPKEITQSDVLFAQHGKQAFVGRLLEELTEGRSTS